MNVIYDFLKIFKKVIWIIILNSNFINYFQSNQLFLN